MALSIAAPIAAIAQSSCPTGKFLGPWKIVQSLRSDASTIIPYGPCASLGERYSSPDAAAAACSPTGAYNANINWGPQTIKVSYLGSADGSSSSFLYGFSENSFSTINGQETVVGFAGRVAAFCTSSPYFIQAPFTLLPSIADTGKYCPVCTNGPDPINPSSGNEALAETDFKVRGVLLPLAFSRYYNSLNATVRDLGPGWTHSFSRRLTFAYSSPSYAGAALTSSLYATPSDACTTGWTEVSSAAAGLKAATATYSNGTCTLSLNGTAVTTIPVFGASGGSATLASIQAYRDDGHLLNFNLNSSVFVAEPGVDYQLASTANGGYQLTDDQNNIETYDSTGKLLSVATPAGDIQNLSYDSHFGFLSSVTDSFGNTLTFTYSPNHQLASVMGPGGGAALQLTYDIAGRLSLVKNLDGSTRQYLYTDPNWQTGISGIVDESGQTTFTLSYDSQGRVLTSKLGGVSSSMSFVYNSDGSTTQTDPLGAVRTFRFQQIGNHNFSSAITGDPCSPCGYTPATTYDGGGFPATQTDYNGNITTYTYDDTRGLETSETEASGTARARTTTTQWHATYRFPALISVYAGDSATGTPVRTTSFSYDTSGNPLTRTETDPVAGVSRTWTYTYDNYGRILTADGPRTDVNDTTTYTYYTCTTGVQCGQVQTVTDAANHVTTYNSYNGYGQPLTITDPNGVLTTLTYDTRQRLTSRQVGSETTAFAYWPTGLLQKVTLADGSYQLYAYDAAHRLTQVSDGLGNSIDYSLDAKGNRTAEYVYDPSNTLHRTHTRVFNTLSELYQDVNAAGTAAVTTTLGYDLQGNPTSIAAPLARNTGNAYDELNRLKQITDPANGVTQFSYDVNDNLTSVTDPRILVTSYGYNGLGDLLSQISPDTGTTTNTYDSAGNLATSTDARGAVATYGYDALNRLTSVAYSQGGTTDQTISFTYDAGPNGKGHLTGASDANHSMDWSYDALGRVTSKSQTVGGTHHSVGYGYTNGNLTSLTTPSGQNISYGYNTNHQVTSVALNGITVLNGVTYEPLGPVHSWTWGNGTTTTRTYDTDGKITQIASNGTKTFSYDDAFRISGITDTSAGSTNWTYGYDPLDRLTSGSTASVTRGWTYDANGNRLTETGSSPSTYTLAPTSNRISSIAGSLARTYGYDAAGNTTSYSSMTATYDDAGRLKTVSNGSVTETLIYNALGQRIETTGGAAGTVLYGYDEQGHLLGEYDAAGNLVQETVWLGDIPVATLRPNGSSVSIYYVHSDQLNTPHQVTRASDNAPMWTWFSDPFGTDAAMTNPVGAGTFSYNLRFPGQIFDGQVGLHSNYYRDGYDPAMGRYVQSDPIGLGGGVNTYAYVSGNPISRTDPLGLIGPQETSIQNDIEVAVSTGNYAKLETLLEVADTPEEAQLIRAALSNKLRRSLSNEAIKQITRNSEQIAKGDRIRKVEELCEKFGGKAKDWVKKKGWDSKGNEWHWYENNGRKVGWKPAGEPDPF